MAKKITDTQILRCIKKHEVEDYHRRENGRIALMHSVRYVLNGGNPYDSVGYARATGANPGFYPSDVNKAAQHSDHPSMFGYEYAGFLADELLYSAGLVNTDIEDYLNEKNISHGRQGRRWLAEAMELYNTYPRWKEPKMEEIYAILARKHGVSSSTVRQSFKTVFGSYAAALPFLRTQKYELVIASTEKKPRGYIGRIHNVMLDMGLSDQEEGFRYLRFAAWVVIRSGSKDRRACIKDVAPVVAQKYNIKESTVQTASNAAISKAAIGGTFAEVLFRLVNTLEPQGKPLYQLADEVLHAHGFGPRQRLKGYECLRVAMVKLAQDTSLFTQIPSHTFYPVARELGYPDNYYAHVYARFFLKLYKEAQQAGSTWKMTKILARELITKANLEQAA